jgi:Cof subfamily protein (haloacid dehalogenase superfamily)
MIKLIATDIDGTLLRDGTLMLDPEYMTVIEKLIAKGIRFVACSGRQFISERKLFAPIRDKLLYITDGGTVVRTPKEILKVHTLPEEIWHGMCETVRNELPDCDYFIATPDYCLAEDAGSRMFRWLTDSYGYDIRESADLMKTPVDNVIKFTVYHPSACEKMCAPVFTPTWQSRAKLASAGKEWVDCNPLGVNKGSAIRFLQEYLGIAPDETCTFGDNLNDIEMLQSAGMSYAVSNASHCRCKGYLCALLGKRSVAGVENLFINSPGHSESKRLTLLR